MELVIDENGETVRTLDNAMKFKTMEFKMVLATMRENQDELPPRMDGD